MTYTVADKTGSAGGINRKTALVLALRNGAELYDLFSLANRIREKYHDKQIDLCSIVNAKSGACPEDCSFCAQSSHNNTDIASYPLLNKENILNAAESAMKNGVKRFCIVTSGRKPSKRELDSICNYIYEIKKLGIMPCATLGMLDTKELRQLKDAGLVRYHHNLESSEAFYSKICTTHSYRDKINTITGALSLGISVCSGGIFGMGESWEDRIDMAFTIKEIGADSVPINFLTPINGTPMGNREMLNPLEALKIISIYRLIMPEKEIRVCGGRTATLRDLNSFIFYSGADGLLLGNYLTTTGRDPEHDLQMIRDMELTV